MATIILKTKNMEQTNIFTVLAKALNVSFTVDSQRPKKKLSAIQRSLKEAEDGKVNSYKSVADFFEKKGIKI